MAIYVRLRFDDLDPEDKLSLSVDCGVDCSRPLALNKASLGLDSSEWAELSLKLSCFAAASDMEYVNSAFLLETSDALSVSISDVKLVSNEGDAICID
jgi:beta-glucosidase